MTTATKLTELGNLFAPGVLEELVAMQSDPGSEGLGAEYRLWQAMADLANRGLEGVKAAAIDRAAGLGYFEDDGVLFKYKPPTKPVTTVNDGMVRECLPAVSYPGLYAPHGPSVRKQFPPDAYPDLYVKGNPRNARVEITVQG